MARMPVLAAGGIVLKTVKTPLIAVVRLRKRNEWVLPKGKLDAGETPRDAAKREGRRPLAPIPSIGQAVQAPLQAALEPSMEQGTHAAVAGEVVEIDASALSDNSEIAVFAATVEPEAAPTVRARNLLQRMRDWL